VVVPRYQSSHTNMSGLEKDEIIGVSIAGLQQLLELVQASSPQPSWTTAVVCEKIVKPKTLARQCSYAELLADTTPEVLGRATVFISHPWRGNFQELVEICSETYTDVDFLWFDLIVNSQHGNNDRPFVW